MATTTAFNAGLSVPALADDSMEMSSPAAQNYDDDLDIDFDDPYDGAVQATDGDFLMNDGDDSRPPTANDDAMEDAEHMQEQPPAPEEEMQDSPADEQHMLQEDEDLIDYGDDDVIQDHIVQDADEPAIIDEIEHLSPHAELGDEHVDEEIARSVDDAAVEQPAADVTAFAEESTLLPLPDVAASEVVESTDGQDVAPAEHGLQNETASEAQHGTQDEDHDETATHDLDVNDEEQKLVEAVDAAQPHLLLNTSVSGAADAPGTPTDTGLHPMVVRYGDLQMPLFKSRRQPDGLLKDDNLASLSLGELITHCRQRLAIKIGEDLSEDQELVLGFEHLGLILFEVCRHPIQFISGIH